MNVEKLYRDRLAVAGVVAVAAATVIARAIYTASPAMLIPAALLAVAAIGIFRLARESYRFDRGEIGPPEWRELMRASQEEDDDARRTRQAPPEAPK